MTAKSIAWDVAFEEIGRQLSGYGFSRECQGALIRSKEPLGKERIGFGRAPVRGMPGWVDLLPTIGVRCSAVDALVSTCTGRTIGVNSPPSYLFPLSVLTKRKPLPVWRCGPDDAKRIAGELVEEIVAYGLPFLSSIQSVTDLVSAMRASPGTSYHTQYSFPAALVVAGCYDEARQCLEAVRMQMSGRVNEATERFRMFASKLESEIVHRE